MIVILNRFLTTYIALFSILIAFAVSFAVNRKNEFSFEIVSNSLEEWMWFILYSDFFLIFCVCTAVIIMSAIIKELLNKRLLNKHEEKKQTLALLYVFAIINSTSYEIYNVLITVYSKWLKFDDTLFQNKLFKIDRIWDPEHLSLIISDAFAKQNIEVPLSIVRAIVNKYRSAEKSIEEVTAFLLRQEQAISVRAKRMAEYKSKYDPYGLYEYYNSVENWVCDNASTIAIVTLVVAVSALAIYTGYKLYEISNESSEIATLYKQQREINAALRRTIYDKFDQLEKSIAQNTKLNEIATDTLNDMKDTYSNFLELSKNSIEFVGDNSNSEISPSVMELFRALKEAKATLAENIKLSETFNDSFANMRTYASDFTLTSNSALRQIEGFFNRQAFLENLPEEVYNLTSAVQSLKENVLHNIDVNMEFSNVLIKIIIDLSEIKIEGVKPVISPELIASFHQKSPIFTDHLLFVMSSTPM